MRRSLLVFLIACRSSSITLPKPTATTAFVDETNFSDGQLDAIDVASRNVSNVLGTSVFPASSVIHTFAHNLYIVAQDPFGDGNSILALSPDNAYAPACGKTITDCQFALPAAFDAQDFWVASANKMYLVAAITADGSGAAGAVSNLLYKYNPLTGEALGTIDLVAGVKALSAADGGEDLLATATDGTINLAALYQVDNHLFVAAEMLVDGPVDPNSPEYTPQVPATTTDACGFAPGRIIVVDTKTNTVVKAIKMKGANPQAPFVVEPGTENLLIATPGSESSFDQEPCNGIERIDTQALVSKGQAVSEADMSNGDAHGGSVVAFDLDAKGNGLAFTASGSTEVADYPLVQFSLTNGLKARISDAGAQGLLYWGFIAANAQGQAYISLPYADPTKAPGFAVYDIATGTLVQNLSLSLGAAGVAFYPGPAFISD